MRKLKLTCCLSAALLLGAVGCSSLIKESWSDSTRKTVHSAVVVVDQFLIYEMNNRVAVGTNVTAVADTLRRTVPPLVITIRGGLDTYDKIASPALKAKVEGDVAQLKTYEAQAATGMAAKAK